MSWHSSTDSQTNRVSALDVRSTLFLIVLVVVSVGLTVWLAMAATNGGGPHGIDPAATSRVLSTRTAALTAVAQALTFLGSRASLTTIAIAIALILAIRRRRTPAVVFASTMLVSACLTVILKRMVVRPRPSVDDLIGPVSTSFSFPSGHTLNTAVLVALVLWLLSGGAGSTARAVYALIGGLVVAGVAWSRVYLGYHWLTDVVASIFVATALLSSMVLVAGSWRTFIKASRDHVTAPPSPPSLK